MDLVEKAEQTAQMVSTGDDEYYVALAGLLAAEVRRLQSSAPEVAEPVDLMAELKKKLPQGAPVAWRFKCSRDAKRWAYTDQPPRFIGEGEVVEPLYASLPQSRSET